MSRKILINLARLVLGFLLLTGGSHAYAQCTGDLTKAAVFTQTNLDGINTNRAVAYYRATDGTLCEAGRWATGGAGSVIAIMLGGKNSVVTAGNCLLVTNGGPQSVTDLAGSVSSFVIEPSRLRLVGRISSRGLIPVSVTIRGNRGYVVNETGNSINGFTFDPATCAIVERPDSRRTLATPRIGYLGHPAQIQYTPDGRFLIVTDRLRLGGNLVGPSPIHVLAVDADGLAGADTISDSVGFSPFGFDFDTAGHLLVSNAGMPFLGLSSVSSYTINDDGTLSTVSGAVRSGLTGACWVLYTRYTDVPTIYVMSLIGAVISSYTVGEDGSLTLLEVAAARTASPLFRGDGLDIVLSEVGPDDAAQYLYGINTTPVGIGSIVAWRVEKSGVLTRVGPITQGPQIGFVGLAAR